MSERFKELEALFHDALAQPEEERRRWAEDACGDDEALLDELRRLLGAHGHSETWNGLEAGTRRLLEPTAPPKVLGEFELGARLGVGGMGEVFVARQRNPNREVAVKILSARLHRAEDRTRFAYESQTLATLQHPAIAHVYASGVYERGQGDGDDDGDDVREAIPWFAMELVPEARNVVESAADWDRARRLSLFVAICEGVDHGHRRGVLHCDLKPSNVLVDPDGRPHIIDFGIAQTLGLEGGQTTTGGTPGSMSPEQAKGDVRLDERADVFALGRLLDALLEGAPKAKELVAIVGRATAERRDDRYPSARALSDEVRRFMQHQPVEAVGGGAAYFFRCWRRRNPGLAIAIGGGFAVLLAGVVGTSIGMVRATRGQAEAERQRARAEEARDDAFWGRDFLIAMLQTADPWQGAGPEVSILQAVDLAAERLDHDAPAPALEAEMREALGEIYYRVGGFEAATDQLARAATLLEAVGPGEEGDADLARVEILLASALARSDRAADGRQVALQAEQRTLDPDLRLRARAALGMNLKYLGEPEEAERVWRQVWDERVARGDSADEQMRARADLAGALDELGRHEESAEHFEAVAAWRRRELGPDHPDTLNAQSGLATELHKQGKYGEARVLYEAIIAATRTRLGDAHPQTLRSIGNFATMLRASGQAEEAEPWAKRAWEGRDATLGPTHRHTLQSMNNYAAVLLELERFDEAERLYEDTIAALRKRGETTSILVTALSNRAALEMRREHPAEAERWLREAADLAPEVWPEDVWERWAVIANHGGVMIEAGVPGGEEQLRTAHRQLVRLRGPEDPWVKKIEQRLAE